MCVEFWIAACGKLVGQLENAGVDGVNFGVLHGLIPFSWGGAFEAPPVDVLFLFGCDAKLNASVQWDGVELKVEPLAVFVLPCGPDACPEAFVFTVTDLIGYVCWSVARGGCCFCAV